MSSRAARIRRFSRQDRRPVVAMLCRAFADDPVIRWFLPATKGGDSLSRFFRASLIRDVLPHGEVQVAEHDGKIVGAALWRHPGEWHNNGVSQLLDLPWWLWVFGRDLQRAGEGLDAMKRAHPSDPHWYLPTIGVDPGAQGLGVGSALMLQRCCSAATANGVRRTWSPLNMAMWRSMSGTDSS